LAVYYDDQQQAQDPLEVTLERLRLVLAYELMRHTLTFSANPKNKRLLRY
jgi:hypothetical protein